MRLKKIILALLIIASALIGNDELKLSNEQIRTAYKLGAFHIMSELDRNIEQQGYSEKEISLKKYIVAKELNDGFSTVDLLLLQRMAYSEGLTPIFTKKYFVFGDFDRKADALYLQKDVLKKSYFKNEKETILVVDNIDNAKFTKQAFLYKKLYNKLMSDIKNKYEGNIVIIDRTKPVEEVIVPENLQQVKNVAKKKESGKKSKEDSPKNKTQYFKFKKDLKNIVFYKNKQGVPNIHNTYKIMDMVEGKVVKNRNFKYKFQNVAKTDVGTEFIKVLNQIYFVDAQDVEIIK